MSRAMSIGQPSMPKIKHIVLEINGQDIKLTLAQLTGLYSAIGELLNPIVEQEEVAKEEKKEEVKISSGSIASNQFDTALQQLRNASMAQMGASPLVSLSQLESTSRRFGKLFGR